VGTSTKVTQVTSVRLIFWFSRKELMRCFFALSGMVPRNVLAHRDDRN
jgi:hypothetical protein